MTDKQIVETIKQCLDRGNEVQVRRNPQGEMVLYEVQKNKVQISKG